MNLLLDSCTFLWIITGDSKLSETAQQAFANPDNRVFLSAATLWEILVKHGLGRLPLPAPPEIFLQTQREQHRIDPLPIEETDIFQLRKLPDLHRDPFDRMLVCQAIASGLAILTPDRLIQQYPVRTIW